MIKLIATDLDGTLLDNDKNLPANFDETVTALFEKNIRFAISSGRSFCTLKVQFEKYLEDMTFICDNGAYIYDRGKLIFSSTLSKETVKEIVKFCENLGLTVLLCGKNGTWHNAMSSAAHKEICTYYVNETFMENLCECDDEIFKIAVFQENGIEFDGYPKLVESFSSDYNIQLSGKYWTDIMEKNVNKGEALKIIRNKLGIAYEQAMAFGDYLNDTQMLENAYYSFAVENAHPDIKKIANFQTGSNEQNSVLKEIVKYCL